MTLAQLIPVRFGLFERPVSKARHSAPAEVEHLRMKLQWANSLIKTQQVQIDDAEHQRKTDLDALRGEHTEVIDRIDARHAETVDGLQQQIADLERRLNIACQATAAADQTQEIDPDVVARICGRPVPLFEAPFATTDPGRVSPSWASDH